MANALYVPFRNGQLGLGAYTPVDFEAETALKFALTDHAGAEGAPDTALDDFYDDIDGSTVGVLSAALASRTVGTVAAGVFDAADLLPGWTSFSGASCESISLLRDSGTPATSQLIGYWDTITGLPLTPNGGNVDVVPNASGILKF